MRTKHIFSAFMLAALAAACTNEEFETVNTATELGNRVEVGSVTLSLGDADTRFEVGPEFNDLTAAVGDAVGACLIDAPNVEFTNDSKDYKADAKYGYDITQYISTNYSFKYNGSTWNSEAKMVEGNYMFYAPYNAKHATRNAVTAKFNPVQQLAANADGTIDELSAIKELKESEEVMAVSHVFIAAADSKSVTTSLVPIYAYPLITLTNSYKEAPAGGGTPVATDLVINQVVITKNDDSMFPTEATFKFASNDNQTAIEEVTVATGFVNGLGNFTYKDKDGEGYKDKAFKGLFAEKNGSKDIFTQNLLNTATASSAAIVVKAPESAYTLKAGASTAFHVVIPAAAYTSGAELTVEIYTNKGVFSQEIDNSIAAGKRYPQAEYNPDGSTITPAEAGAAKKGDTYTVNMESATSGSDAVVASTADLATLIQNTNAGSGSTTLSVKPLNKNVQINAAVMNAIKAKSNTQFTVKFTAPVTIATSISTNKTVEFAAGAEIAEGTITLGNGAKFSTNGKLDIKGGTVTIDGAGFDVATIENNGGAVTVKSNIVSLANKGGSVSVPNVITGALTNNGGTLAIGDGNKAGGNVKTFDNDIANTKGTLEIKANTTASGVSANAKGAKITNNGTATVTDNKGEIDNYGTLNATANSGLIVMADAAASVTVSGDTGGAGMIKNNIDATSIDITSAASQVIYYEFTEDVNGMLVPQAGIYNAIVLNGMTWSPSADQTLGVKVIMEDATISVYTPDKIINIANMHIVKTDASNSASTLKGNTTAKINVTAAVISGDVGAKLVVSNVAVKENTDAGGSAVATKTFAD